MVWHDGVIFKINHSKRNVCHKRGVAKGCGRRQNQIIIKFENIIK